MNDEEIIFRLTVGDLVTSDEATARGFEDQVAAKREYAAPHLQAARSLREKLLGIEDVETLIARMHGDQQLRDDLITAAGYSDKSTKYLRSRIEKSLENFLQGTFSSFSEPENAILNIVERYLLTRGDTLGGSIRNWIGANAKEQLTEALLEALQSQGYSELSTSAAQMPLERFQYPTPSSVKPQKIRGIAWHRRLLLFDATPTAVKKVIGDENNMPDDMEKNIEDQVVTKGSERRNNIDVILLAVPDDLVASKQAKEDLRKLASDKHYLPVRKKGLPKHYAKLLEQTSCLLACGELKGGIDPAGADEHWKTAVSALGSRIRQRFTTSDLKLFFIGAAIENAMAQEIVEEIKKGELTFAANLTKQEQVKALANWLVTL